MPRARRSRIPVVLFVVVVALVLSGLLARHLGNGAYKELMQLRQQVSSREGREPDRLVRARCFEIADDNPGTEAEVAAYLFVAGQWPEVADADVAHEKLLQAAKRVDIGRWTRSLRAFRSGHRDGSERWRPLAALLIERVREQPDHPNAVHLLCETAITIHPDTDVESAPPELLQVAALIHENYAKSPDLANFCEVVGNLGNPVRWSLAFESHVRHLLEVNEDRFVRCSAHFALASIVRSGGSERQAEARQLYTEFLARFDGETEYHAQGIERANRAKAKRVLETIRLHGLGTPAPSTVGIDLEGQPMSLADYRGKVVLLSFWATWCAPCMKAIPYEKNLLDRFGLEQFAIVGVNADREPAVALQAVAEHDISWRSFQVKRDDGSSIADEWHVAGYPTFCLLDAEGVVAGRWMGLPPDSEIRAAIGKLVEDADTRQTRQE